MKGARESLNGRKNVARRKVKNGEKSPWGQCLTRPVPNGRRRSGFWLVPEYLCFSGKQETRRRNKNEQSKDYCKADLKQRVLFFITIFWLAIPAFFRFTDVTSPNLCWVFCVISKGGLFWDCIRSSSSTHICLALRRLLTFCFTLTR